MNASQEKRKRRARLLAFSNRLSLRPVKRCRVGRMCILCVMPIRPGDQYRSASNRDAHEFCFQALAKEFK